jgi:hypothetical protein
MPTTYLTNLSPLVLRRLASEDYYCRSNDDGYDTFLTKLKERVHAMFDRHGGRIFQTDASGLFAAYMDASPYSLRVERGCHACNRFIESYGGLVVIFDDGTQEPLLWDPAIAPPAYVEAAKAMAHIVRRANVVSQFVPTGLLGTPETKTRRGVVFRHYSISPPPDQLRPKDKANAIMAASIEEYGMLKRGLDEFHVESFKLANAYLSSGALPRSEKHAELAKWLLDLKEKRAATKNLKAASNLVWLASVKAPVGWCHVKSGIIGTLLEDISSGMSFDAAKRRFAEKIDPRVYQRPQAPPTAGNVMQAEKLIAEIGVARSLERRFAKLEDVDPIWVPKTKPALAYTSQGSPVFGHLLGYQLASATISHAPPVTVTWQKFQKNVLPFVDKITLKAPAHGNYGAIVTAKHSDAPNILQWSNPHSWYVYHQGSVASQWGLVACREVEVSAIVNQPSMPLTHHGESVFFALRGARDTKYVQGAGLFPGQIKSEFHGIRSTIEAYWRTAVIADRDAAEVCGVRFPSGQPLDLSVTMHGVVSRYSIDRWD